MKTVIVASTNPVKIASVEQGFARMFPDSSFEFVGVPVPSGVSDQPTSDLETYTGAMNRAQGAQAVHPDADYWVGLEGGVEEHHSGDLCVFGWVAVRAKDERHGKGRSSSFFLPNAVAELVRQGVELGSADDQVFGRTNSKQANGAIGLLTNDVISRSDYLRDAVVLALIPSKNEHLF